MAWCENNGIDYLFGLPGNKVLQRLVDESADDIRTRRALERKSVLRGYAETHCKAKSWKLERRVCARIEATAMGSTSASSSPISTKAPPSTSMT